MFVIDAFISNNDRNEGNWGLILDRKTNKIRIAPVFDNGAAFFNKSSSEKLYSIYDDDFKFKQSVYDSCISVYKKDGKPINPDIFDSYEYWEGVMAACRYLSGYGVCQTLDNVRTGEDLLDT